MPELSRARPYAMSIIYSIKPGRRRGGVTVRDVRTDISLFAPCLTEFSWHALLKR